MRDDAVLGRALPLDRGLGPVSTITNIVNLSLSSGNFHHTLKESVASPLLKKPTLDKDELSNYRPISNL